MAATQKNPIVKKVSGKVVKKTTRNLLNPFAKPKVSIIVERTTRKPAPKANAAEKIAKTVKKVMVDPTSVLSKPNKTKPTSKPKVKLLNPKTKAPMPLKGPAAVAAIQKRTSPEGVKNYDKGAKKALEKKYPGLYKKNKGMK